jgi:hypothetical protein
MPVKIGVMTLNLSNVRVNIKKKPYWLSAVPRSCPRRLSFSGIYYKFLYLNVSEHQKTKISYKTTPVLQTKSSKMQYSRSNNQALAVVLPMS